MTARDLAHACAEHICALQHRSGAVLSQHEIAAIIAGAIERAVTEAVAADRARVGAWMRRKARENAPAGRDGQERLAALIRISERIAAGEHAAQKGTR